MAGQIDDPGSLLHLVRRLIALRQATPALGTRATTRVLHAGYPLVYLRGDSHVVAVNPRRRAARADLPEIGDLVPLVAEGAAATAGGVGLEGFGFGVFELVH